MTARKGTKKPAKPRPNFPLWAHANGQWVKKVAGESSPRSFGKWEDPAAAEQNYLDWLARQRLGIPEQSPDDITVAEIVDHYLDHAAVRVERFRQGATTDKLSPRTLREWKRHCTWFRDQTVNGFKIGRRSAASLGPNDFTAVYSKFPPNWSCDSIRHRVSTINCMLKWAKENGKIKQVPAKGTNWKIPKADEKEAELSAAPAKRWTRSQIKKLMAATPSPHLRAMILLGINAAFGNSDCGRLQLTDVRGEWLEVPRGKNGRPRKAWLWPETREALETSLSTRPDPQPGCGELFFLTHTGGAWTNDETFFDGVGDEFREAKKACKFDGSDFRGVSFYSLRHTFAEEASNASGNNADDVTVQFVLGHIERKMLARYRRELSKPRIKKVCQRVRTWYVGRATQ